jgi:hypothetical protein
MSRVLILVEGPTEQAIVDEVFKPVLAVNGVYLYPRVVGKPGHKGGNKFVTVKRELRNLLGQEPNSTVTMLFDYYGLTDDWPGKTDAKGKDPVEAPKIVEQAIAVVMQADLDNSYNPTRFIPYIQMHEIEALLFAGPKEMAQVFGNPGLAARFEKIVRDCGGCENINDKPDTAPSKRIRKLYPNYRKGSGVNAHAYRIAQHIGVERIRQQCPHFDEWMTKLEQIKRKEF